MRPTVWLSDLARACETAGARTTAERKRIALLLGLAALREGGRPAPPPPAAVPAPPAAVPAPPVAVPAAPVAVAAPPVAAPAPSPRSGSAPTDPAPVPAAPSRATAPATNTTPPGQHEVPSLPVSSPGPVPQLDREPLLDPRFAPSILQMAVRRHVADGAFDVEAAVRTVAMAQPLITMPRRMRATSAFGVQVLADLGTGMQPFAEDHEDVLAVLDRLIGRNRMQVSYFADCPVRGAGVAGNASWRPWTPPPRGTRVLLLTDLGIGGFPFDPARARPSEWRRFDTQARRSGVEPVAFVPYPPARWPVWAVTAMPVVHWDRRTTAASVDAAMRRRR